MKYVRDLHIMGRTKILRHAQGKSGVGRKWKRTTKEVLLCGTSTAPIIDMGEELQWAGKQEG